MSSHALRPRLKLSIAQVLKDEGYIEDFAVREDGPKKVLRIGLKYYAGRPVIERIERISKPGLRVYKGRDGLPKRDERTGRGDRLDLPWRHDRPQGARHRRRRRSALHRRVRMTDMSRIAKHPIPVSQGRRGEDRAPDAH